LPKKGKIEGYWEYFIFLHPLPCPLPSRARDIMIIYIGSEEYNDGFYL
jgi:hypothetical protein